MSDKTILVPIEDNDFMGEEIEIHMMTVGELKAALELYDDDMKVIVMVNDTGYSLASDCLAGLDSDRSILYFGESPNSDEDVAVFFTNDDDDEYDV
jgi:hypothetical protein